MGAVYVVGCENIVCDCGQFSEITFAFVLVEAGVCAVYVHGFSPCVCLLYVIDCVYCAVTIHMYTYCECALRYYAIRMFAGHDGDNYDSLRLTSARGVFLLCK